MRAIILAAGRGSRMKSLTEKHPKCLVKLDGKSLLDGQINSLKEAGIKKIGIVTGYKRESLTKKKLKEFYNEHWKNSNMVFSLTHASDWLSKENCIVSYSDIFYSAQAVRSLIKSTASIAITYDPNWLELWKQRFYEPLDDAETFRLSSKNTLLEIGGKPNTINEIQGQYMGLLRFTPNGWSQVIKYLSTINNKRIDKLQMTEMLQGMIMNFRVSIKAIPYRGFWGEIDSKEDLKLFQEKLKLNKV